MKWVKDELTKSKEHALEEIGRYKGRVEAYTEALELFNPDKRCPACGYIFYNADSRESHYEGHQDHRPLPPTVPGT